MLGVLAQFAAAGLILVMLGAIQKKIFVWHTRQVSAAAMTRPVPTCPSGLLTRGPDAVQTVQLECDT